LAVVHDDRVNLVAAPDQGFIVLAFVSRSIGDPADLETAAQMFEWPLFDIVGDSR